MRHPVRLAGALALLAALGAASAEAGTASSHHRHARAKSESGGGRQITVHKGSSYLTLGGVAGPAVTSPNNYVLDTFSQPAPTTGTLLQGRAWVLDNRFDGPGIPLFKFF
jgi:hypothetical protein